MILIMWTLGTPVAWPAALDPFNSGCFPSVSLAWHNHFKRMTFPERQWPINRRLFFHSSALFTLRMQIKSESKRCYEVSPTVAHSGHTRGPTNATITATLRGPQLLGKSIAWTLSPGEPGESFWGTTALLMSYFTNTAASTSGQWFEFFKGLTQAYPLCCPAVCEHGASLGSISDWIRLSHWSFFSAKNNINNVFLKVIFESTWI